MSTVKEVIQLHRRSRQSALVAACALTILALLGSLLSIHPFLATNDPVAADVLVVEGWVPDYVLDAAAVEIQAGKYRRVFVSGFEAGADGPNGARAAGYLSERTVGPAIVTAALAPPARWNRTSHMARTVAAAIEQLDTAPRGVNVITLGPHGRQSLLAYRRMIRSSVPVGVITIPKDDYDPDYWWASVAGIKKTTKDFAGWAKEWAFGSRR
jgi:hypothetical protein